jgi:hypothetical protein
MTRFLLILLIPVYLACQSSANNENTSTTVSAEALADTLQPIRVNQPIEIMILGSYHFAQEKNIDETDAESQRQLSRIYKALSPFRATKIFIEHTLDESDRYNSAYRDYREGSFRIDSLPNETFQLGFKMAGLLEHDSVYLFDDQTEFIGSLENFSFKELDAYARANDTGFFDKHLVSIQKTWGFNQYVKKSLPLYDRIKLLNSPQNSKINAQRMHAYEMRIGIGDNWMGPDWLGRWYRRNVRMLTNLLKQSEPGDRVLVVVGDNHKWVLEDMIGYTPDFKLVSSYEYL